MTIKVTQTHGVISSFFTVEANDPPQIVLPQVGVHSRRYGPVEGQQVQDLFFATYQTGKQQQM